MKCTADEKTMELRRLERLQSLTFFMRSDKVPPSARRLYSLKGTHDLLTGYFQNSYWRTAWWCFCEAVENSWMETTVAVRVWWYRRVLRLTDEQIDERF